MELRTHSFTDLITNSSTTIYTYSDNSLEVCREMIDEFFRALDIDKKCDDVFNLVVTFSDEDMYEELLEGDEEDEDEDEDDEDEDDESLEEDEEEDEDDDEDTKTVVQEVREGKRDKPQWMIGVEEFAKDLDDPPETSLYVSAKRPQFEKLAKLLTDFLYSTDHTDHDS